MSEQLSTTIEIICVTVNVISLLLILKCRNLTKEMKPKKSLRRLK